MPEEIKQLRAAMTGDAAAFEKLVIQYQSLVCAITFSGTGRVDVSEELAQETFLNAWKNLRQLKDLDGFRGWLCAIARNRVHNYYRRKETAPLEPEQLAQVVDPSPTPSEHAISQEELAMLETTLMQLPEDYRQPLVLFYRQGQSTRQVAAALGLNESTVRTRLHRAKQMLREEIASRLETTLKKTGPDKTFTKAVMVAVGATGIGLTAATAKAATTTGTAATATSGTLATIMSTTTAKIIALAAAAVIVIGAVYAYRHLLQAEKTVATSDVLARTAIRQETTTIAGNQELKLATIQKMTANKIETQETELSAIELNNQITEEIEKIPTSKATETNENSEYVFEPNGVLSGLITDAQTDAPITDTEIWISCGRIYTTKTDKHGFYSFDKVEKHANYEVSIHSWDHIGIDFNANNPPTVSLGNGRQVVKHFQLEKACMIEVTVIDEASKPIKGADVFISRLSDSRGWRVGPKDGERHYTNQDGFILLGGLPPKDTYYITVQHSYNVKVKGRKNYSTHRYDYAPSGMEIYLGDPNIVEIVQIELEKGQKIRSYAQYQDGEPASDITIVPEPTWWKCNNWIPSFAVEPNGFFTLDHIVPGDYNIQARIPRGDGWTGRNVMTTTLPLKDSDVLNVTLPFNSPKNLASISGTIKWMSEKKPNYIEVRAYSAAFGHFDTTLYDVTKSMPFKIDRMTPGKYTVTVEGTNIEPVSIKNVEAPTDNLVLEVQYAEKPKLLGVIVDASTQKPLKQFKVRVRKLQTLRGPHYTQSDRWFSFTRDNGSFEVEVVGPGIYEVQAQAEGYVAAWSQKVNTDKNEAIRIALSGNGGKISGQVINQNGKPVAGATVVPLSKAGGNSFTTKNTFVSQEGAVVTDEHGQFQLTELTAGTETLKVSHPDYTFIIQDGIEVQNGHCSENINITLPKGAVIEGFVYDHQGKPQKNVVIRAQNEMGHSIASDDPSILTTAVSEPNGFYRFTGLPQEVCYLMRQDEWNTMGVVRRTIVPAYGQMLRVDFGGTNSLTGQIILQDEPLANQQIVLSDPCSDYSGFIKAYSMTDDEGRFVFRGIVPGSYGIYYKMNQERSDWFRLTEFDMVEGDYDLGTIPKESSTLYFAIQQPKEKPWNISSVYFYPQSQNSNIAIPYEQAMNPDEPYEIGPVVPGEYKITISCHDELSYGHTFSVSANTLNAIETVVLPECTASLYGTIDESFEFLGLQCLDKTVSAAIRREGKETYRLENLPAGTYRLGEFGMPDHEGITINLADNQELEFNIDRSLFGTPETATVGRGAYLFVSVASETGEPLSSAEVRLSSNGNTIEPATSGWHKLFIAPPGEYLLQVSCKGHQDVEKTVTLKPMPEGDFPSLNRNQLLIRLKRLTNQ